MDMHAFAMTLTSDLVSALISGVSAAIAMASAWIAYISLREQRQLTVNIASFNQLAAIENMYDRDRSLLELHGIDLNDLAASGITASELI
jgi:hypothetical protein